MKRLMLVCSLLLITSTEVFSQTTPSVKNSFTNHDFFKLTYAYNNRTILDAYQNKGHRDPKWDKEAVEFLNQISLNWSLSSVADFYRLSLSQPIPSIEGNGKKAIEAGCDDPLVQFCYAVTLKDIRQNAEYFKLLQESLPALLKSNYPLVRKLQAVNLFVLEVMSDKHKNIDDDLFGQVGNDEYISLIPKILEEKLASPEERHVIYSIVVPIIEKMDESDRENLLGEIEDAEGIDPWLKNAVLGALEIKVAWDARGSGWASSVKDEGWKKFHAHLVKARKLLIEAYKLEPSYAESSANMITVVSADENENDESADVWFNRAIKGQVDYYLAWDIYSNFKLPRWGGSHLEMYKLGCLAMNTNRYDTNTPFYLIQVLNQIITDKAGDYRFLKEPGVWNNIDRVFQGYLNDKRTHTDPDWMLSYRSAWAFRCGKYEEVAGIYLQLKDRFNIKALKLLGLDPEDAIGMSRAIVADSTGNIRLGYRSEEQRDYVEAQNFYASIWRKMKEDDPDRPVLERHDRICATLNDYENGKTVVLETKTDGDLLPWRKAAGLNWKILDGLLVFDQKSKSEIYYSALFDKGAEIQLEWMFSDPIKKVLPGLAIQIQDVGDDDRLAVMFNPNKGKVALTLKADSISEMKPEDKVDIKPDVWHSITIRHHGDTVTVKLDGKMIFDSVQDDWFDHGKPIFGIWAINTDEGSVTKIRNISISQFRGPSEVAPQK